MDKLYDSFKPRSASESPMVTVLVREYRLGTDGDGEPLLYCRAKGSNDEWEDTDDVFDYCTRTVSDEDALEAYEEVKDIVQPGTMVESDLGVVELSTDGHLILLSSGVVYRLGEYEKGEKAWYWPANQEMQSDWDLVMVDIESRTCSTGS